MQFDLSGTNLTRAGDHNQRVTLHAVRVGGPVTRSELASKTGLTPPAIANITNRLLKHQLILKAGRFQGARGQPFRASQTHLTLWTTFAAAAATDEAARELPADHCLVPGYPMQPGGYIGHIGYRNSVATGFFTLVQALIR
jgi:hypothetical protein